jgi:hypothetical protein
VRVFGKKKRDEMLSGNIGDYTSAAGDSGLDPELQELMDLEEAERQAQSGGAVSFAGQLDPELQELMNLEEAERRAQASNPAYQAQSRMDQLQQLGELHAQGILTDAEFEQEKARILNQP